MDQQKHCLWLLSEGKRERLLFLFKNVQFSQSFSIVHLAFVDSHIGMFCCSDASNKQSGASKGQRYPPQPPSSEPIRGDISPLEGLPGEFCGDFRGIQGDFNSCYLDTSLYAMFSFSMAFDGMLHRPAPPSLLHEERKFYEKIQEHMKEGIVNPLRR